MSMGQRSLQLQTTNNLKNPSDAVQKRPKACEKTDKADHDVPPRKRRALETGVERGATGQTHACGSPTSDGLNMDCGSSSATAATQPSNLPHVAVNEQPPISSAAVVRFSPVQ
ncbi:hypothetical protein BDR03DRAFT_1008652 [Suillus americanus]|nr:hypothetical protein BDR03DRAFT_1008652 [Suillus americanus]